VDARSLPRHDQAGGDLDRAGSAEDVDQDQLAVTRTQSGVDRLEASKRPAGDDDLDADARSKFGHEGLEPGQRDALGGQAVDQTTRAFTIAAAAAE
jgi:hypothetical protein